jgi:hypothetical protein
MLARGFQAVTDPKNVTSADSDADTLWDRAAKITNELGAIVEEALRVRDQHAARIDALAARAASDAKRIARMRRTIKRLRARK